MIDENRELPLLSLSTNIVKRSTDYIQRVEKVTSFQNLNDLNFEI